VRLARLCLLLKHPKARLRRRQLLAQRVSARAGSAACRTRLLQLATQHVGVSARRAALTQRSLEAVGAPLLLTGRILLCTRQLRLQRSHARLWW
jgi:hypothetical protein